MDRLSLVKSNPWWEDKNTINTDEKIIKYDGSKVKYNLSISLRPNTITVIRGPRQVGKTTLIKLKIRELIKNNISPYSLFFYSCDMLKKTEHLVDLIETYYDVIMPLGIKPIGIFLDEVTNIKDWAVAIKHLKNKGLLSDCAVLITGSNSMDLKKGSEKLSGRGIEGNEWFYYPLPFNTYCDVVSSIKPSEVTLKHVLGVRALNKNEIKAFSINSSSTKLKYLFDMFMKTGGFLKAINERENERTVFETYIRWIEGDLTYFKKDVVYAKQVASALLNKQASQTSLRSIVDETEIGSHITVREYITLFEEMRLLFELTKFDTSKKKLKPKKRKKYHFIDPLLYHSVSLWCNTKTNEETIVEGIVAAHLYRYAQQNSMEIGFYNDGNNEVDILLKTKDGSFIPVEVKWSKRVRKSDFKGLYKFGRGILVTKNEYGVEKDRYIKIPAFAFLASLKINPLQKVIYI